MVKFFLTGGFLRDRLLNIPSKDLDYAVEASSYQEMKQAIIERDGEIFLETEKYLTIRARIPKFGAADFVLCRKDGTYIKDRRRPDFVEIGTLFDDLSRRDATINALAEDENGNIIDFFNGLQHLKEKRLVCVGNPQDRIKEDALRGIRFLRFSITKGFWIDDSVKEILCDNSFVDLLNNISSERIRDELLKMFSYDTFKSIQILNEYTLIKEKIFKNKNFGIWLCPSMKEI